MTYQFIVISATEDRLYKMKEQFSMLEKDVNVHYLEASMISNSKDYLDGYENAKMFKFICCARSHIRALEYATKSNNCDFSIILEDDVAFYKDGFLNAIEEIIGNWHEYEIHKMMSIGWIPCQGFNYNDFCKLDKIYTEITAIPGTKVTYRYYLPGLQGYIVKNVDMIPYVSYLLQPTYIDFCNKMKSWQYYLNVQKKFGTSSIDNDLIAVDTYFHMLFNQAVVFPPLVIEQNVESLLGHTNKVLYWDIFFKNHESERKKYMFY